MGPGECGRCKPCLDSGLKVVDWDRIEKSKLADKMKMLFFSAIFCYFSTCFFFLLHFSANFLLENICIFFRYLDPQMRQNSAV